MNLNLDDLAFFRSIDHLLEKAKAFPPAEASRRTDASLLADATYEAADRRLERGLMASNSHLGTIADLDALNPENILGALKRLAIRVGAMAEAEATEETDLLLETFELANALVAEARETGISSEELPALRDFALDKLSQVTEASR